ncbi:MAG: putative toxin-antitoxin system toxin component, PIN family [Deltaproteobacteria bacterium]|nr:putative toxin-antitoxin system toxin component, PIN family [Deltaproteobacteria bacterium]
MRIVIDTNVAVSGLLWDGPPNQILKWVQGGTLTLLACEETVAELKRVIQYKRFSKRLATLKVSSLEVFAYYSNLVFFVPTPDQIPDEIVEDPFDNVFLALASENGSRLIVSSDNHLLELKSYNNIWIVTPSEACQVIERLVHTV